MVKEKKSATYDDLKRLPENLVGEIIDGELFASPRPASPHAHAGMAVSGGLWGSFGGGGPGPGGWWILPEPELHFGADVLVPDVAGWRRERMPKMPKVAAFELPPDWLCEVLSPSTERLDRARKMDVYARVGIPNLWLVNPLIRTLEIYALGGGSWKLVGTHSGDERVRAVPFDAVELALARWWIDLE